jgi:hypothetical protein
MVACLSLAVELRKGMQLADVYERQRSLGCDIGSGAREDGTDTPSV